MLPTWSMFAGHCGFVRDFFLLALCILWPWLVCLLLFPTIKFLSLVVQGLSFLSEGNFLIIALYSSVTFG
jgi:hypothetical protein